MFLKSLAINSDQTARLLEHDFGDRWGNRFTEQAVLMTVVAARISPSGELIGGRCMSDVGRATAHDKAKHHLRRAVSGIPQCHCLLYKRSRHSLQESFMFTVILFAGFLLSVNPTKIYRITIWNKTEGNKMSQPAV